MMTPISYFRPSEAFIEELSTYLKGKKVLEVFAGNGYLAKLLADKGVDIRSTTLFSGHDGHQVKMYFPVDEIPGIQAVKIYKEESDVLLMSWPLTDQSAYHVLREWGPDKPVVYIGETPHNRLTGLSGLSGCASDEFFDSIIWEREFASYSGNMLEKAGVIYGKA